MFGAAFFIYAAISPLCLISWNLRIYRLQLFTLPADFIEVISSTIAE